MDRDPEAFVAFARRLAPSAALEFDALRASVAEPAVYALAHAGELAERGVTAGTLPKNLAWLALADALAAVGRSVEVDWKEGAGEARLAIESISQPPLEPAALAALDDLEEREDTAESETEAFLAKLDRTLRGFGRALVYLDIDSDSYPLVVVAADELAGIVEQAVCVGLGKVAAFAPLVVKTRVKPKAQAAAKPKSKKASAAAVKRGLDSLRRSTAEREEKGGFALLTAPSAPFLAGALARAYLTLGETAQAIATIERMARLRLRAVEERQRMYGARPEHSKLRYDYTSLEEDAGAFLVGAFGPIAEAYDRWGIEIATPPYSHLGAVGVTVAAFFRGRPLPAPTEQNLKDARRWKYEHVFELFAAAAAKDRARLAEALATHVRRFPRDYDGKQTGWWCFLSAAILRQAAVDLTLPEDAEALVPRALLRG